MDTKKAIWFIINPISGGKDKTYLVKEIEQYIDQAKFSPTIKYTERAGHGFDIAKEAVINNIEIVVACGGDGTINEIGKALVHTNTALAIIPLGSGNGLARHLGIPLQSRNSIKHINNSVVRKMDVGEINKHIFLCTTGLGFDALISERFSKIKGRGFKGYLKAIFQELKKYKAQEFVIDIDGNKTSHQAFILTVANANQYGNNAYIAPTADSFDGKLNITIVKPFSLFYFLVLGYKLMNKKISDSNHIKTFEGQNIKITIQNKSENYIHVDGEPITEGNSFEINILKSCLLIVA